MQEILSAPCPPPTMRVRPLKLRLGKIRWPPELTRRIDTYFGRRSQVSIHPDNDPVREGLRSIPCESLSSGGRFPASAIDSRPGDPSRARNSSAC